MRTRTRSGAAGMPSTGNRTFEGIDPSAWLPKAPTLAEHRDAEDPILADDHLFEGELDRPERD